MFKSHSWVKGVNRLQIFRATKKERLRLDCAERLIDFSDTFFEKFLSTLNQEDFITYPSYAEYNNLKNELARFHNCLAENIVLSAGSDAIIKDIMQITCKEGSEVLGLFPSFPMYKIYAETFGATYRGVECNKIDDNNFDSIISNIKDSTSMVILANPGSPFGEYTSIEVCKKLADYLELKSICLVIDEAYVDFTDQNCLDLIQRNSNVIITRTFSKAWGAAGARIGYAISNRENAECISRVGLTYPISGPSLRFAIYLLQNFDEVESYIKTSKEEREKLIRSLESCGYEVIKSQANTIHIHEKDSDNSRTCSILNKYNVAYKSGNKLTGTAVKVPGDSRSTWIRISVGEGIINTQYMAEILDNGRQYLNVN